MKRASARTLAAALLVLAPDSGGTATLASHGSDLPDLVGFDTDGLTEARIVLDDAPSVRVDLVPPPDLPLRAHDDDDDDDDDEPPEGEVALFHRPEIERLETEPGGIPHITGLGRWRTGSCASPWPTQRASGSPVPAPRPRSIGWRA